MPLLEWCHIPAGVVIIESRVYRVNAFAISKYPITYAQFQAFVTAGDGYAQETWWAQLPRKEYARGPAQQRWPISDHPREHVSWYEAIAFCRWLSYKTDLPISLPTEQQWQRAAQGDDGRAFPWGERYDDTSRANTRERALQHTTPVTEHTKGVSPYGVFDMGGNVWEWCLNLYERSSYIGMRGSGARVLRGGSWFSYHNVMNTSFRYFALPKTRDFDIGFRVVQSPNLTTSTVRPDLILTARHLGSVAQTRLSKRLNSFFNG